MLNLLKSQFDILRMNISKVIAEGEKRLHNKVEARIKVFNQNLDLTNDNFEEMQQKLDAAMSKMQGKLNNDLRSSFDQIQSTEQILAYSPDVKQTTSLKDQGRSSRLRATSGNRNKQNIQVIGNSSARKFNPQVNGETSLEKLPYQVDGMGEANEQGAANGRGYSSSRNGRTLRAKGSVDVDRPNKSIELPEIGQGSAANLQMRPASRQSKSGDQDAMVMRE